MPLLEDEFRRGLASDLVKFIGEPNNAETRGKIKEVVVATGKGTPLFARQSRSRNNTLPIEEEDKE